MKAYKGFNKDMTCRGFQFREGETYHEDTAELCKSGFHACEAPIDCFSYYAPAKSVYREVELDDVTDERLADSKVCGKTIKIGAEIGIPGLVKAHFEFRKRNATTEHTDPKSASAGEYGAASAGASGAASAGASSAASAGAYGAASAGACGAASAGACGAASAGASGAASAGASGAASSGAYGAAPAGKDGAASAGEYGAASAGKYGAASAGKYGAAVSRGSAEVGVDGIAVVRGSGVKVKGGLGAVLLIAEENRDDYEIAIWKAVVVDGETIKPDTWYKIEDGELVVYE